MLKISFLYLLVMGLTYPCFAGSVATPIPNDASATDDQNLSPDQVKEKIELLRLENENLKLKLQLQKAQAQTPSSPQVSPTETPKPKNEDEENERILREEGRKAGELAKAHKDDAGILVVDYFNDEIWYKGARYGIRYFPDLAKEEGWKLSQKVVAMNGSGRARNLYQYQNLSLLIYDGEEKGIFTLTAPQKDGDLDFLTPEGFSFKSTTTDVRNADFTTYFKYDGMEQKDSQNILKYKHDKFLAFGDEVQFFFTHEDKLAKIRFGLLGER